MGEARRRGTYEQRKQDAIKSGRNKDNKGIREYDYRITPLEAIASSILISSRGMYYKNGRRG